MPKKTSQHGPTARCEACGDLHYKRYLNRDPRADKYGVGKQLCYACATFIEDVSDEDYVFCCTEMHADHRREQGLNW
jgi:hypothetical protein